MKSKIYKDEPDPERVLVIAPESPWPSNGGGQLRSARFAEVISEIAEVRYLSLYATHSLQAPAKIDEIVVRPDSAPVIWSFRTDENPLAPELPAYIVTRIQRLVDEFRPTIVIFEQTVTTGLIGILDLSGARIVFNSHNFDTNLQSQLDDKLSSSQRRLRRERSLKQELAAARASDLLICCSELDAAQFKKEAGIDAKFIPNPLPDDRVFELPISRARYENPNILFVGAMGYQPNQRAVMALVRTFPPNLPPGSKIVLVGNSAKKLAAEIINHPQVEVVSDAPEILPFLERASFSVMPIREGGGTRLKVLEAMAAGVVVVATSKAVEGLGLIAGTHYVAGETDDELLAAYNDLIQQPGRSLEIAQAAREFVKARYAPEFFALEVHEAIKGVGSTKRLKTAAPGQRMIGTFHKSGTVLILRIFDEFRKKTKTPVWTDRPGERIDDWAIAISQHSDFEETGVSPLGCPVTIIVRDPRDIVISSAFYHMKSNESWLQKPRKEFGGRTYQEEICALPDMKSRFSFEMHHAARHTIQSMLEKRANPDLAHATWIKLEDLMTDEDMSQYRRLFVSLKFSEADIERLILIARKNSTLHGHKNEHIRDPRPQQWRRHFDDDLLREFDHHFGDAPARLGYE